MGSRRQRQRRGHAAARWAAVCRRPFPRRPARRSSSRLRAVCSTSLPPCPPPPWPLPPWPLPPCPRPPWPLRVGVDPSRRSPADLPTAAETWRAWGGRRAWWRRGRGCWRWMRSWAWAAAGHVADRALGSLRRAVRATRREGCGPSPMRQGPSPQREGESGIVSLHRWRLQRLWILRSRWSLSSQSRPRGSWKKGRQRGRRASA